MKKYFTLLLIFTMVFTMFSCSIIKKDAKEQYQSFIEQGQYKKAALLVKKNINNDDLKKAITDDIKRLTNEGKTADAYDLIVYLDNKPLTAEIVKGNRDFIGIENEHQEVQYKNDKVYYVKDNKLYMTDKNGTNATVLYEGEGMSIKFVVGNWIYFSKGSYYNKTLYRIRNDKTEFEELEGIDGASVALIGTDLYFVDYEGGDEYGNNETVTLKRTSVNDVSTKEILVIKILDQGAIYIDDYYDNKLIYYIFDPSYDQEGVYYLDMKTKAFGEEWNGFSRYLGNVNGIDCFYDYGTFFEDGEEKFGLLLLKKDGDEFKIVKGFEKFPNFVLKTVYEDYLYINQLDFSDYNEEAAFSVLTLISCSEPGLEQISINKGDWVPLEMPDDLNLLKHNYYKINMETGEMQEVEIEKLDWSKVEKNEPQDDFYLKVFFDHFDYHRIYGDWVN